MIFVTIRTLLIAFLMTVFSAVLFLSDATAQNKILLSSTFQHQSLFEKGEILRADKRVQLSEVQTLDRWVTTFANTPLSQDQALWIRYQLQYDDNLAANFAMVVGNPALDYLDVYVLDDKNRILESYLVGAKRNLSQRPINNRNYILPLYFEPGQNISVYVRIRDDGPAVISVDLWRDSELVKQEQFYLALIGVIGGALAILFCYFLITYVMLRSPIRFWFAIANLSLLMLFLNVEGILSQITGLGAYTSHATSVLVALTVLAAAKVSHNMLIQVPMYWRFVSYVLATLLVCLALVFDTYWQIILGVALAGAAVLLQLLLAILFHNRDNSIPNRMYTMGWLIISTTSMLDVSFYLSGYILDSNVELLLSFIVMSGVLLIAVAIESHEQLLTRTHQVQQQNAIANLRQFYDLFKNSAEGLYTSSLQGRLVTTNPAMCSLFGYDNEQQMLEEVTDTSMLYANLQDRDILLGQIYKDGMVLGKELKGLRRDGSEFWFSISVQLTKNGDDEYLFGSVFDVTEKKQSSISLEYLATHDSLTGVYNRREFEHKLQDAIHIAKKNDAELTLLYMDLDQFKIVNDTCGHKAGDALIKQLSQLLNDNVMKKGILARLGGDEFGVLLRGDHAQAAPLVANQCLNLVKEFRFIWDNRIFTLGVSIGIAKWDDKIQSPEQLLSMADAACYMAKEQGRNQVHTYSSSDEKMQRYESELNWVSHINSALEDDLFVLYYQHYYPLTKVADGHHYELLLRMHGKEGQLIPPSSFFPAAERYNLTAQIDRWVIQHYFQWLSNNVEHMAELTRCNINLSGHSLADKDLKLFVLNAFEKYSIPYHKICFEITESMAIIKMDETLRFINTFKQLGCSFALDDFGSGFSSYSYLKNLPVNCVKIDGSFVKDLLVDPIDFAMVCSMKDVARAMGMYTVAEFVESKDIMVELGKIGVDFAQGYGVAKPAPLSEFVSCRTIN